MSLVLMTSLEMNSGSNSDGRLYGMTTTLRNDDDSTFLYFISHLPKKILNSRNLNFHVSGCHAIEIHDIGLPVCRH
jgi:hypothetical protein